MPGTSLESMFAAVVTDVDALFERCHSAAPNYKVTREEFTGAVRGAAEKYLGSRADELTIGELRQFANELQTTDLYLALACAKGDERAWWDFDARYRRYIERIARHLASAETDAEEVIDVVYTELYGTRLVEGVRQSKFTTYSGRGSLHGWLRVIVWHAIVDAHRARHDEISIDDWSESGGEAETRPGWTASAGHSEHTILDGMARERYRKLAAGALDAAFAELEDHEKLLLLYYHVENMKLREIARLVEDTNSPLRMWFQRQSKRRLAVPDSRVHESTVMRWLEKVYGKVSARFRSRLVEEGALRAEEIELCMDIASEDLASERISNHLLQNSSEG
ncbi:MAG TPA: hypothetical protein VM870_10790 [Pyrinomonadaceae bacterium]|nr:hypothetical protein [Pyrinomonadaceae bacterium]